MISVMEWWRDDRAIFATHPAARPEGARFLGVGVLDDEGIIRAWEVILAQGLASHLVPDEAAQEWIDGLPSAACICGVARRPALHVGSPTRRNGVSHCMVAKDTTGASKPVEYEIRKLRDTNKALATGKYPPELHDQLVEAYALHLRNLIEFLYDNPKNGYVRAEEFFSDPGRWRNLAGTKSETLGRALGQASEQVAHLTYKRAHLSRKKREWHIGPLSKEIVGVLGTFLAEAEEDRMGPELVELKRSWGLAEPENDGRRRSRRTT